MKQEISANDNGQDPVACIAQQIHKEIVDPPKTIWDSPPMVRLVKKT